MAKGEKKVSINTVDAIVNERFINVTTEQWFDVEVTIRNTISFQEMLAFVDDVAGSCFQDKYGYMPELLDFAIRSNIVKRYTNISLPDNLEHRYDIIARSNLVDFVCAHINTSQLKEITTAIENKISNMCRVNVHGVQKRMDEIASKLEEMGQKTEELFAGIEPEDVSRLVSAMGDMTDGKAIEEKIVGAYLKEAPETKKTPARKKTPAKKGAGS